MTEPEIRQRLLLSVQRALLGVVPPTLRSVTCEWEGTEIRLRFIFDGEINEDRAEDMRIVGSEVIADFNEPWMIKEEIERLDFPEDRRSRSLSLVAYARLE